MSNRPEERLDRRDFIIASITTAGASTTLAMPMGLQMLRVQRRPPPIRRQERSTPAIESRGKGH